MRLKDKTRKERVQRLARSTLASSIFQWKLGLGPESVFPKGTSRPSPQIRDHHTQCAQSKPQSIPEQKNNVITVVLDQWTEQFL